MKVILLNCSYRGKNSNTRYFLTLIKEKLIVEAEMINLIEHTNFKELSENLREAKAIVVGSPLYVDGFPGQVVELLENIYAMKSSLSRELIIYGVTNMGFYESKQMETQLRILKNFCTKSGFIYGGSLAIGAGEMMRHLDNVPIDKGPNKIMGEGIIELSKAIDKSEIITDYYSEPKYFPMWLYMKVANYNFKKILKKEAL